MIGMRVFSTLMSNVASFHEIMLFALFVPLFSLVMVIIEEAVPSFLRGLLYICLTLFFIFGVVTIEKWGILFILSSFATGVVVFKKGKSAAPVEGEMSRSAPKMRWYIRYSSQMFSLIMAVALFMLTWGIVFLLDQQLKLGGMLILGSAVMGAIIYKLASYIQRTTGKHFLTLGHDNESGVH